MIKKIAAGVIGKLGYTVVKNEVNPYDADAERVLAFCRPYTMTSRERMFALFQAVRYLHANRIAGSVVECGVWRGGSSMVAAMTFRELGDTNRDFFMYDTYEGMSAPGEKDVDFRDNKMTDTWENVKQDDKLMCFSTLEEVQNNMMRTGYPAERIYYVKGKVEDTIPATLPGSIALLRLDTDWYESTRHELEHLYPLLSVNGVLIIDDYGHWKGARAAVDEYFAARNIHPLLNAIDYSGRIMIKTS
jgi:O-methyltransferase